MAVEKKQRITDKMDDQGNENEDEVSVVDEQETDNDDQSTDSENIDELDELVAAQATVKEYWDQILRLKAEIQNNQKRAQRDIQNAHSYSLKGFAESLLPIVDSMEMGMDASVAENSNVENIREGMELTMNMFNQVLEKHGLYQVNPVGEKFNPEEHQAISMLEDKEHESNTVITVMQKGYLLNGRLVRPAMVVVSK